MASRLVLFVPILLFCLASAHFHHSTAVDLGQDCEAQLADGLLHTVDLYAPWYAEAVGPLHSSAEFVS